jgi:hypothetical protein
MAQPAMGKSNAKNNRRFLPVLVSGQRDDRRDKSTLRVQTEQGAQDKAALWGG